ncbi:hypothetical protein [Horticoccus sp. 23ND18S-11]|uniref:hypothetical protein n=1 Tax=Horticoccus sp. 23ND18S-11 TaxID=3391832 RepID=UPI0039C9C4BE
MRRKLLLPGAALAGCAPSPRVSFVQQPQPSRPPLGIEKIANIRFVNIGNGGNGAVLETSAGAQAVCSRRSAAADLTATA